MNFLVLGVVFFVFFLFAMIVFIASRYKRCPSNQVLAIFGKVGKGQSVKCFHGGGAFVWPLIQDARFLDLTPLTINIPLKGALSFQNIRINVPSTFTIAIDTNSEAMNNAAVRLLELSSDEIERMATEIIFGQLRLTVASLRIEDINQDREKFLLAIRNNIEPELRKIGLTLINVNITDITDESGYIEAIGKKAAAEAINKAKVEVAEQVKFGSVGEATAVRDKEVQVAEQQAQMVMGQKAAERDQRIKVAKYDSEGSIGEAEAKKEKEIAVALQMAKTEQGKKEAEKEQRIVVAELEAKSVEGENKSQAEIAKFEANLQEAEAEAKRRGEVATATARRDVLKAEKEAEVALLQKQELARQEVEKMRIEVEAEAEAEKRRRVARGEADAIIAKYNAEAEGIQAVLNAKAEGYRQLFQSVENKKDLVPTMLMVEKIEEIVKLQTEAIKNIRIDKITVWDSGNGEKGSSTAGFLSSLVKSLPALQDISKMAGVELPDYLGKIIDSPGEQDSEPLPSKKDIKKK